MTRTVVVGATGAVGTVMLRILADRAFPVGELVPVASARSAGRFLEFAGKRHEIKLLEPEVFQPGDLALFDVPDEVSREWAPVAVERGAVVVDNSAAWRMDDDVPLVVPEVNPADVHDRPRGIIASPNCTTLAAVVPLAALHRHVALERVVVASYQAASGSGRPGLDELWDQTERLVKDSDLAREGSAREVLEGGPTFGHPISMNVIPRCGSMREQGYTSEELKLCFETRKIMHLPDLRVTATCVRVPVAVGHGVAVHAEFAGRITPETARRVLSGAPGVEVVDDPDNQRYPTPLDAAGTDPCYVGRIRQDLFSESALEMFCVADNLRKGAALNTVQVAELLASES